MKTGRTAFLLTALALSCTGCDRESAAARDAHARVVHFYNWSDYVAPDVIAAFEAETGIRVQYDVYDSAEILETKLLIGRSGYDVVLVGGNPLRLVGHGMFRPLDRTLLPHWRHLDAGLMGQLATHDPGNRHVAGYMWGTTGIGYNASQVKHHAPDAPVDSWRLVFDPAVAARVAHCGLAIMDSRGEVIATALAYLGRNPNSTSPEDLGAVENLLAGIRPSVRKIDTESQITDLATGEICVMVTWATNVAIARARAAESGAAQDLRYLVPREGTISWFDGLAVPADAPHPAEAHAFIDYLLRPDVAAKNANYIGTASVNMDAKPLLLASVRNDPGIYPPPEVMARLTPLLPDSQEQSRAESRVWTRFKTGQ